ncbi:HET-domain-containing protein [Lentinus brumalis]|uniref:HET-domain-containing protein n=1 Tax=Lentinus brumalis TaxID=2498619 RepID=A0A371D1G2_9APHY|nr:HET-domain-containing protein [Polyporus brumalis]
MWLNTWTGEFVIKIDRPRYAILSHVWNVEGEQSYSSTREIQRSVHQQSQMDQLVSYAYRMSEKIRRACAVARAHGYRYIWVDSCCIDKTSSAELSEAINSMFTWYRNASVCYAFLPDVRSNQSPRAHNSDFRESRWFTRGWTLQELLAPEAVVFLSHDWQVIGTKSSLASLIALVTTIPTSVLLCTASLRDFSVARRMSWASKRSTTRVEDEAYSLLGIFDINMPTLYGEG